MSSDSFELPSFAKVNWLLRVLGKRPDGFHELCTIFQTVSLCDRIRFEPADDLTLECSAPAIPTDGTNLILRAANLLRERYGVRSGARLVLEKHIPAPGGLGGGSSNAATALLGLAVLWDLEVGFPALTEIGASLGSDVPFFFYGGTALGSGRGELIEPLPDFEQKYMMIVTPAIAVPTSAAFGGLNLLPLTKNDPESILELCRKAGREFKDGRQVPANDFERSIFATFPEIERVRDRLVEHGADLALLSGSGASVFAVFEKEETRQATLKALGNETDWRMFAVATVSRDEYRRALGRAWRLFPISF